MNEHPRESAYNAAIAEVMDYMPLTDSGERTAHAIVDRVLACGSMPVLTEMEAYILGCAYFDGQHLDEVEPIIQRLLDAAGQKERNGE